MSAGAVKQPYQQQTGVGVAMTDITMPEPVDIPLPPALVEPLGFRGDPSHPSADPNPSANAGPGAPLRERGRP
jgi:hypothetical protein